MALAVRTPAPGPGQAARSRRRAGAAGAATPSNDRTMPVDDGARRSEIERRADGQRSRSPTALAAGREPAAPPPAQPRGPALRPASRHAVGPLGRRTQRDGVTTEPGPRRHAHPARPLQEEPLADARRHVLSAPPAPGPARGAAGEARG